MSETLWPPFRVPDSDTLTGIDVWVNDRVVWSAPASDGTSRHGEREWRVPVGLALGMCGTGELTLTRRPDGETLATYPVTRARGSDEPLDVVTGRGVTAMVNKWGQLALPVILHPEMQQRMLEHTADLMDAVTRFGLRPYLMAGMLLGAVRDGDLLPSEEDGDIGYVSDVTSPVDMIAESYALQRFLETDGYEIFRHSGTHIQVKFSGPLGAEPNVDIFGGFYSEGWYTQPFQVRAQIPREALEPTARVVLRGVEFASPADPDPWLEANYGPGWKVPDPAFRFSTPHATVRRMSGWFGAFVGQSEFWDTLYEIPGVVPEEPSVAAQRLVWDKSQRPVIDVGCGIGIDAEFLARAGRRVIGLDVSGEAIAQARARTEGLDVEFFEVNLAERRQVLEFLIDSGVTDADVLMSRVLESVPGDERANVFLLADAVVRDGTVHLGIVEAEDSGFSPADPRTWYLSRGEVENRAAEVGFQVRKWQAERSGNRHLATAIMTRGLP